MQKNLIIAIGVAIIVGGAFISQRRSKTSDPTHSPTPSSQMTVVPSVSPTPLTVLEEVRTFKEFTVTATQFTFEPSVIRVTKGDVVRLKLVNADVAHGIVIPEFNVNLMAGAGVFQTTEFTADKAGIFDFYCSVYCGSGHPGMRGQLVVE
ncbi:MAG: cupredoxin domain-containing protein [bacterium]|nr:cupredoxin domain-containing protein [bacterium]